MTCVRARLPPHLPTARMAKPIIAHQKGKKRGGWGSGFFPIAVLPCTSWIHSPKIRQSNTLFGNFQPIQEKPFCATSVLLLPPQVCFSFPPRKLGGRGVGRREEARLSRSDGLSTKKGGGGKFPAIFSRPSPPQYNGHQMRGSGCPALASWLCA